MRAVLGGLILAACQSQGLSGVLRQHLFGTNALPAAAPTIALAVAPPAAYATTGQAEVDRWTFSIGRGFMTVDVYYYRPGSPGDRLVVLHNGHCAYDCPGFRETAQFFLDRGWAVAVVPMPGHTTMFHNTFPAHEAGDPWFMRLFLEPTAFTVGYAETLGYHTFAMVGLSGGGWTTHVYAAIDERIRYSVPIAGSLPVGLRDPTSINEMGDYEQVVERPLYALAGYEALYRLGARGRRQTQILNEVDPCCFASSGRHDQIDGYARAVNMALTSEEVGGVFRVVYDGTHVEHRISAYALSVIEEDLRDLGLD